MAHMPNAQQLRDVLIGVYDHPWDRVNVYPCLVELIAGKDLSPEELVKALGSVANEAMRGLTVQHPPLQAFLIRPFVERWEEYVVRLVPEGQERREALQLVRRILAEIL